MSDIPNREVILEQVRIGNTARVTAIDVKSGTEVVFQAPFNTSPRELQRLAVNKLKYVMNKEKN